MPKFAANLTMLFTESPFLERFKASREAGFKAVEFLFPYDFDKVEICDRLKENMLKTVLFNLPAGDWGSGERGIAGNPFKVDEFKRGVDKAIKWAKDLEVSQVNCLVGKALKEVSLEDQISTMKSNIAYAADTLAAENIDLLIEFVNRYDVPGFLLNNSRQVLQLIDELGKDNIYMQYDVYHAQREEGNLAGILAQNIHRIKHVQVADNPGRNQPGTGEINYKFLLNEFDRLGYEGYVSMEYIPKPNTLDSLCWVEELGFKL